MRSCASSNEAVFKLTEQHLKRLLTVAGRVDSHLSPDFESLVQRILAIDAEVFRQKMEIINTPRTWEGVRCFAAGQQARSQQISGLYDEFQVALTSFQARRLARGLDTKEDLKEDDLKPWRRIRRRSRRTRRTTDAATQTEGV